MPRIRLSTTRVQSAPATNFRLGSGWTTGIRAMKEAAHDRYRADQSVIGAIDSAIIGADRIKTLIDRRAEKDADEAVTQWETSMLAGVEGTMGRDGKPQGGIAQTTWQTYEGTDRSPITDLGEIEKTFQSSDAYKGLSGLAREKFNRKVASRRAQYLGTANRIYDRQRIQRTQFMDAQADLVSDRKIETAALADDATFESVAREETCRRMNRKFRPLVENPERIDDPTASPFSMKFKTKEAEIAYNAAILEGMRTASLGRCAKMAENAAVGDPQFVGGRLVTNEEQLAKAEKFAASLKDPYVAKDGVKMPARITPQEYERLQYRFLQARSQLDDRIRKAIAKESGNILAKGDLKTLEAGERQFAATAKGLADGSVGQTAALLAQKDIAKAADARATTEILNDLVEGKRLTVNAQTPDGSTVEIGIFDPVKDARKARLFPSVYHAFNEKRQKAFDKGFRAAREQNLLAVDGAMMRFAAEGNPSGFYDWLAGEVVSKRLTAGDFQRFRDQFSNGWMKGFKGSPDQRSAQSAMAKDMLGLLKDKLGVDFSTAVKTDDYGDPVIKNGTLDFDEKAELPPAEVKSQFKKPVRHGDFFFSFGSGTGTRTEEISGEQVKGILSQALSLWSCNGMKITFDPVTGEKLPDGKTHTVDARQDFAAILDRIRDEKNILSAAETLKSQATYANNIRNQAAKDMDRRRSEMAGSRPVTDKTLDEKGE